MQITRENLNPCTVKFDVSCTPEQVTKGYQKAVKSYSKNIKIPGFRAGQAPRQIVEKMINPVDLRGATSEEVVRIAYKELLKQENIQPFEAPHIELKTFDYEAGVCEFSVKVPLAPVVTLGEYKGIRLEHPRIEITESDMDGFLEELCRKHGQREPIKDRGAQADDIAVVNLKLSNDPDGPGKNFMSIVGKTFPALDNVLIGMHPEEEKQVELSFPGNFQQQELAGKTESCIIRVNSLSAVQLKKLDDEFARSLDEKDPLESRLKSDTVSELREKAKDHILKVREHVMKNVLEEQILEKLVANSEIQVADTTWESVARRRLEDIEQEARKQKKTLEDVAKEEGKTLEAFKEEQYAESKIQVERATLVKEIFSKEKLSLTNEDMNRSLIRMAAEYKVSPQILFDYLKKHNQIQEVQFRAVFDRVLDFLRESAEIIEKDSS